MAEVCRFSNGEVKNESRNCNDNSSREQKCCSFLNVMCVFISMLTIVADLTSDILVSAEYWRRSYLYLAGSTLLLAVLPAVVVQIFSLRWLVAGGTATVWHWLTHVGLLGVFERYIAFLRTAIVLKEPLDSSKAKKLQSQRSDLNMLHLFNSLLESAPQIVLQTYSLVTLNESFHVKAISLALSMWSMIWAGITYIYGAVALNKTQIFQWPSFVLKSVWHFGMLVARLAAIILFTIVFGIWTFVPLGIHWAAMTCWIITQKTSFCPTKLEEILYNIIVGFIYCFCYFNLCEGQSRYRLMTFYTLMVTQNLASLFLFMVISDIVNQRKVWAIIATVCILGGTVIGLCGMLMYYRWFHPKGPIKWRNVIDNDIELNNKDSFGQGSASNNITINSGISSTRLFKESRSHKFQDPNRAESSRSEVIPQAELETTDKKILLDHWIARSGTPTFISAPITNDSMEVSGVEFYTVENTPQSTSFNATYFPDRVKQSGKNHTKNKKKGFCSPTELNMKLSSYEHLESSIDELIASNPSLQKRRGICSLEELKEDLQVLGLDGNHLKEDQLIKIHKNYHFSQTSQDTDSSNKKTSSDSIDMDLDLSFSDINSSDINEFNENIVQKLCLSTLKNIKVGNQDADIENIQRIALDILKEMYAKKGKHKKGLTADILSASKRDLDTPTEMLSVHDYENICAVNIAREAWGLRSWNGYCDIENWLHDGSVVRDRRRDTLTSGSSEISSCLSQELKNSILSAPPIPTRRAPTYSNIFVKNDKSNPEDYVNTVMCQSGIRKGNTPRESQNDNDVLKTCILENLSGNHLEPIIEELDDFGDLDPPCKSRLNSESSLVATIDEIRKATIGNSPRNVYHRRENIWDSPQLDSPANIQSSLKRALWKEPSKFNPSNILESLPEKENKMNDALEYKVQKNTVIKQALPTLTETPSNSFQSCNSNKNSKRRQKITNVRTLGKKNNIAKDDIHDLSNKDVDFLWQLVSETSLPLQLNSTEDLTTSQITSSLQSLISKEPIPAPVVGVTSSQKPVSKKSTRNRPRRKFSILRERFEPKLTKKADEEALYQSSENINRNAVKSEHMQSFIVNVKNELGRERIENHCQKETVNESSYINEPKLNVQRGSIVDPNGLKNIKEKRSLFLKQVLSPPKFNTKLKYKS